MLRAIKDCCNGLFFSTTGANVASNTRDRANRPSANVGLEMGSVQFETPSIGSKNTTLSLTIARDINPIKTKAGLLDLCLHYTRSRIRFLIATNGHAGSHESHIRKHEDAEKDVRQFFSNINNIEELRTYTIQSCTDYYTLVDSTQTKERGTIVSDTIFYSKFYGSPLSYPKMR